MKAVFLKGKNVYLSPLTGSAKFEEYLNWINDQAITLFMGSGRFPMNEEDIKKYIENFSKSKDGILLGIFKKKTSKYIGNITLHLIDWRNRNAEIGIIIGDKKSRGKGYATEAIFLVAEHAFNKLNLRKLYAGAVRGNEASRRIFEKVGFQVEGILREHFYCNGEYSDCYRFGLLFSEFISIANDNNK